jgi:hypothetical protein
LPDERVIIEVIENDDAGYDASDIDFNERTDDGGCEEGSGCDFEFLSGDVPSLPMDQYQTIRDYNRIEKADCLGDCEGLYHLFYNRHHGRPQTESP